MAVQYDTIVSLNDEASPEAPLKPKVNKADDLKTNMGNERTFFKWLFTGLHIGTMGTWILKFFSKSNRETIWLVLGLWLAAFLLIAFGLYRFYKRRWALHNGVVDTDEADSPFAVVLITATVTICLGGILYYSVTIAPE